MVSSYLFILCITFASVLAQSASSTKDALDALQNELPGKIDENQLKDLQNKSSAVFKEKCEKNGGPDAFSKSEKAYQEFQKCIQGLVNVTQLTKEMEEAKPHGTLDEVFKRYCVKTPEFKNCFKKMTDESMVCFSSEEKQNLKIVHNITEQLADFICYKEGDRITLFIAENGPECFNSKQDEIQKCVNSTFGGELQINTNNLTANSLPNIAFTQKECSQLTSLQKCMVKSLESCQAPTTANIVDSLFRFIRQATPCLKFDNTVTPTNSANGYSITFATALLAAAAALLA